MLQNFPKQGFRAANKWWQVLKVTLTTVCLQPAKKYGHIHTEAWYYWILEVLPSKMSYFKCHWICREGEEKYKILMLF